MDYRQLEEQRQVSGLQAVTRIIWDVLRLAAIPLSAGYVAHWYTASARWSVLAFFAALAIECVMAACMLSSDISQREEGR